MFIKQTAQTLTFTYIPFVRWAFFGLFTFIVAPAVFAFNLTAFFSELKDNQNVETLSKLIPVLFFCIGIICLVYSPLVRMTLDISARTVIIKRFAINGISSDTYNFDDLMRFQIGETEGGDSGKTYRIELRTRYNETVKVTNYGAFSESKEQMISKLNKFLLIGLET